jgi:nitrate/TMAO reductase-like tetraheme cytochrome c subunit
LKFKIPHLPFWVWTLGGVLTILAVNAAVTLPTYTTTKKEFCITCHHQQRESSFWEQSTLHPKINCSECHATGHALMPSINIFPLKSEGEHAGFSAKLDQINPNCIRCHQSVFDIERTSPNLNPYNISIPHRFHIEQLNNSCTSCHYNIYHDPHDPPTFRPTKEACFECHKREKTACSTCHPKGAIPLPKTTEVSHSECTKCHKGFEDLKIKIYDLPFPHRKHIARILDCSVCHATGEEHGKILKTRIECLSCHHQTGSKCIDCHERQGQFIRGEAIGEKEPQPDVMADGVSCIECHTTISKGHTLEGVKRTCVQCHEVRYGKMTDEWQKEINDKMKKLRLSFEALNLRKKMAPDSEKRKVETIIKEGEGILKAIDEDKSRGVHNLDYAKRLMGKAEEKVLSVKKILSK